MDSNDLERERGITILAKNTAVRYQNTLINIVDTPGHADFGGEVERVLGMVDGCILIVDANEGPMPQTRFVLKKALEKGLRPIVVVNKIDRPNVDPNLAVDKVFDLFVELGADDDQCDFTTLFASGMQGFAKESLEDEDKDMQPLFEAILHHVPPPAGDVNKPLQLQVTTLDYSEYLGRIVIGRIHNGVIKAGQQAALVKDTGAVVKGKITKLLGFEGLKRVELNEASAGNIVAVAGFADANIGETVTLADDPQALPLIKVDEPTLQMTFSVNDSPFAGQEGTFVTSRQIRDRLMRELETNVALRVEESDSAEKFLVSGRGELHLGILIETMRREGYEFQVSQPQVIYREINGQPCEPYEYLVLDVPEEAVGSSIERLGQRKGEMQDMQTGSNGRTQLEFVIPARGLIGFRGELVYKNMIIGESNRPQDVEINICKTKQLTNHRSATGDELVQLQSPVDMSLERALEYIGPDELVEITPKSIRLRKLPVKKLAKRCRVFKVLRRPLGFRDWPFNSNVKPT